MLPEPLTINTNILVHVVATNNVAKYYASSILYQDSCSFGNFRTITVLVLTLVLMLATVIFRYIL